MTTKQFMLQYNMKKLVKSSQEYKEYMNSSEIVELQLKIDLELTKMEQELKVFLDIYNNLDTNKDEFTLEGKAKRDLAKQEQQKIVKNELEKNQVMEEFREKLEMLRMNHKVYDNKEG